jgi:hypothetical protein
VFLSYFISRRYGARGMPNETALLHLKYETSREIPSVYLAQ